MDLMDNKTISNKASDIAADAQTINRLFEQMNELYNAVARKRNLSSNAFSILYSLYECDGLSQKQLSDRAYIPKQTVSYTVKKLREEGFISEEAFSGRESRLMLTQQGREQVEADITPVIEAEHHALSTYGEKHRRTVIAAFESYVAQLKESFIASGLLDDK